MRSVEEALREIRDKAAAMQFLADCAAEKEDGVTDRPVFGGIADICGDVATLADSVRRALDVDVLSRELRRERG